MVKISRDFFASAKNISETCTNRIEVYEAMKRSMQKSMEHKHSVYIKNLYTELNKRKIGTTTVETLCTKICTRLPKGRKITLINTVIRWKLADAYNELRKSKYENTQEWRKTRNIINKNNVIIAYERLWSREIRKYESELEKQLKRKIKFLETKYKKKISVPDYIEGFTIKDQILTDEYESLPRVYGSIDISDAEKSLLSLPPKYAIYEKIDGKKCEAEIEKSLAKLRWEMNSNTENRPATNIEFINIPGRIIDFTKMKSTDLPFNNRIILPQSLDEETEISMQRMKNELVECTRECIHNNPIQRNLTQEQQSGLKSLMERSNNQEIIIFETDKTKRFTCDSAENYRLSAEPHTNGDETITEETKKGYEKLINAHAEMWCRIINAGKDVGNHNRIRYSMKSKNCPPAPLTIPRKDHKEYESQHTGPPGRPLCSGDVSYNMRLSHLLSIMLAELHKEEESICSSTEDLIAEIDRINREGIDSTYVIGSADVDALYPSLDVKFTVDKICETIMNTNLEYKNINYKETTLYIALNKTQNEIDTMGIQHLCPRRKNRRGPRPNITGSGTAIKEEDRYRPWIFPNLNEINDNEKKQILAEAIRIVLHTIMETHTYTFDGYIKRQTKGGPIGVQLTGETAQIFMSWWDKQIRGMYREKGIDIKLYMRYVDDINTLIRKTEPGTRYVDNELIITDEAKIEDERKQPDEITMNLFKEVAETIHESIKLKVDYPSNYEDRKIPILNLKVWVEETDEGTRIIYEHYEKEIASKMVIHAESAIPTRSKITILTQEMLKILTHCSPFLPWERRCEHINKFMQKLQYSGYNKRLRYSIADSALKANKIIIQQAMDGIRPINRPRNWNREERRIEAEKKKKEWYKRGGFESVLFIPPTPNSKLKKIYQQKIIENGFRIKVTERCGTKLKQFIQKTDPFKPQTCMKDDCFPCKSNGKGDCLKESITYRIECQNQTCTERNIYNGETAYNGYTRGGEHINDLRNKNERCCLWRHCLELHGGETQPFKMDVLQNFKNDAMLRQITEAVNINATPVENIMNTRAEWNMPRVPRARITES